MWIPALVATCAAVVALVSSAAIAQISNDAVALQPAAGMTKASIGLQNRQLSKAVRHALYSTKGLNASSVAVLVKHGTVSLVDTVPDAAQIPVAGDVAKRVPHAATSDNRVIVEEEGAR